MRRPSIFLFFFFNDTATTEIYTLSLHDALPIYGKITWELKRIDSVTKASISFSLDGLDEAEYDESDRSEEHTSELQSPCNLVCRLLLEKKKTTEPIMIPNDNARWVQIVAEVDTT